LLLNFGQSNKTRVSVYGPDNLEHYIASMRLYARRYVLLIIRYAPVLTLASREQLALTTTEIDPVIDTSQSSRFLPVHCDENISVFAIPAKPEMTSDRGRKRKRSLSPVSPDNGRRLRYDISRTVPEPRDTFPARPVVSDPPSSSSADESDVLSYASDRSAARRRLVIQDMFRGGTMPPRSAEATPNSERRTRTPAWDHRRLVSVPYNPTAISYLVVGPKVRGKFLPGVAKQLGVKPGPDFGKLTSGQPVTNAEGVIIRPEQCMEAGSPASVSHRTKLYLKIDY
jgi:ribonuclease Z